MAYQITDHVLLTALNNLPIQYKEEVYHFIQFLLQKHQENTVSSDQKAIASTKRKFGYFPKGSFKMLDNFDDPLDCFKDYIQ